MLSALESVLGIILTIATGFVLARRNWFKGESAPLIARLVLSVSIPAYMISYLMGGFDRTRLLVMLQGLPLPFLVMLLAYGLGKSLARLVRIRQDRRGTFAALFAFSNALFVGLPVNVVLFGPASVPPVLVYYTANTILFFTIGAHGIACDAAVRRGGAKPRLASAKSLGLIFSPPICTFLATVLLILAGVRLPKFALDFSGLLGSLMTPLSMLYIGIVIAQVEWARMRFQLDLALVVAGRYLVTPMLLVLMAWHMNLPSLMKAVFLVQAAMPAMTLTPILTQRYGADSEFAGLGAAFTTVLGLVTIPACKVLVTHLF
jgi:predicted permease